MKKQQITTYTLIEKYKVQSKTIYNLKHNKNITTATLETLCDILSCTPNDIIEFKK
ncbi:helix-turn-helix transcriptional regulator [uncultured Eubacterium sp.]|uniref:helix-turn-helix domain-containing protein n=1 Tax=uncultured Eubacterium sp. TaxID=165185 RepID=UPI0032674164